MKAFVLRYSVGALVVLLAVQVFRVSRDTADAVFDRIGDRYLTVELRSDRPGMAKLYWNIGNGYNETDSASTFVHGGERWQRLRFPVPKEPLLAVRFDPLRSEGRVEIREIQMHSGSGRSLIETDLENVRAGVQVESMTVVEGVVRAVFPIGAHDPSLQFGSMVVEGTVGSASFPWIGYMSVAALLFALFLMRKHSSGAVLTIRAVRSAVMAWIVSFAVIDRPGKAMLTVGGLLVVALQIHLLYPLHEVIDLPIWDEAVSMGGGVRFLDGEGLGYPADSPLSKLIYAGLVRLFGTAGSVFANHYLVKVALVLVLFLFSARAAGSVLVGLVLSGVWALSSFQLEFPILTYQSALIWFGLGLLAIERNPFLGLALIVFAALTRFEYQFAVFLVFGFLVVSFVNRRRGVPPIGKSGWIATAVACCVAIVVFVNLSGWNSGTSRGWYAVMQHYAVRLDQEGEFPGNDAFLEYALVTDRDFPEADSLGTALRVNPDALIGHVLWNLRHLPGAYFDLFVATGADILVYRFPLLIVGLVGATGLIVTCRSPRNAGRKLRALISENSLTGVAVVSGLLVIIPGTIVFAKSAYLLPVVPLGLVLVSLLHRLGSEHEAVNRTGALFALGLVLATVLSGNRPFLDRSRPRPVLATVAAIDDVLPGGNPVVLLGVAATNYADYLGSQRVTPVEPLAFPMGGGDSIEAARFDHLIEKYDPDLIMIDSNWRRSAYFDGDGAAQLPELGWTEVAIPDGSLWTRP